MNKLSHAPVLAHKVVKTIFVTLSPSNCGSTVFGEIFPIPTSYILNLLEAFIDPCVS
jgi:hypothetical protein